MHRVLVQARALQSLHNVKMRKHWSKWSNTQPRLPHPMIYNIQSHPRKCHIKKKNKTKQRSELTIYAERSNFVFFLLLLLHTFPLSRVCRVRWNQQWLFSIYQICSTFRWHSTLVHFVVVFFFVVASLIWTHFRLFGTGVVDGWLGWFGWSPMQIYTGQIKGLCCPHSLLQRAKSTFSFLF